MASIDKPIKNELPAFELSADEKSLIEHSQKLEEEQKEEAQFRDLQAKHAREQSEQKRKRPILVVKNLIKRYGDGPVVLKNISFQVDSGEIVCVLGENAAGKTTLFKCIANISDIDEGGEIYIEGVPHYKYTNLGVLWVEAGMDPDITLRDNLKFYCELYDMDYDEIKIKSVLKEYNLDNQLNTLWKLLSTGQKRKSAIARTFLYNASLYLIDEPTSGLDFNAQNNFQRYLSKHADEHDAAYMVITHQYSDLEDLCHKILILDRGQILDFDTKEEINRKYLRGFLITLVVSNHKGGRTDVPKILKDNALTYYMLPASESNISTIYVKIDNKLADYNNIYKFLQPYIIKQKIEKISLKVFVDLLLAGVVFKPTKSEK